MTKNYALKDVREYATRNQEKHPEWTRVVAWTDAELKERLGRTTKFSSALASVRWYLKNEKPEVQGTPAKLSVKLSPKSEALFRDLIKDADNWSGTPLFGGNVGGDKKSAGNLTDLKKKELLTTCQDEENKNCQWVHFTDKGLDLAKEMGLDVSSFVPLIRNEVLGA